MSGMNGAPVRLIDLTPQPQWVAWRAESRRGKNGGATKLTKIPYVGQGVKAEADQPATWLPHDQAAVVADAIVNGQGGGIGIELGRCDPHHLAGIDLDACRDPETGELAPWAQEVLDRFQTYSEVSPSQTGVKLFPLVDPADVDELRALMGGGRSGRQFRAPGGGEHGPSIELYTAGRFFAVTWQALDEQPGEMRVVPLDDWRWLIEQAGPALQGKPAKPKRERAERASPNGAFEPAADGDILIRLGRAAHSDKGLKTALTNAAAQAGGSRSEGAMGVGGALKRLGWSFADMAAALFASPATAAWAREKGDQRQMRRIWDTSAAEREACDQPEEREPAEISLAVLQHEVIEDLRWIVPDYLPEGLTVFAGRPKIGKSWLMLGVALGVARGSEALDRLVEPGDVLYCGLEDGKRRMKARTDKLIPNVNAWPANFTFRYRLAPLDQGGLGVLEQWCETHPERRLIVIDVLARVRGEKGRNEDPYQYDYRLLTGLQQLATRYRVAIVVVHHVRKSSADDVLDTISGTVGIAGTADLALVLGQTQHGIRLAGRGRDTESIDKLLEFDAETCRWSVAGEYDEAMPDSPVGSARWRIADLLRQSPLPLTPATIADRLRIEPRHVRMALSRMVRAAPVQAVRQPNGSYVSPAVQ